MNTLTETATQALADAIDAANPNASTRSPQASRAEQDKSREPKSEKLERLEWEAGLLP